MDLWDQPCIPLQKVVQQKAYYCCSQDNDAQSGCCPHDDM